VPEETSPESELEHALRWLATRKMQQPFSLLVHAIEDPEGDAAAHLTPLVAQTASIVDGTSQMRALAVWGLIVDTVSRIGPTMESRRRNALVAAFRLPRQPEITEPWRSTLTDRFNQLMALRGVYGDPRPTTITPMHQAWTRALKKLVHMLRGRLLPLAIDGAGWQHYVEIGRTAEAEIARDRTDISRLQDMTTGYRPPSSSAQPVFLDLIVTTVFMRGRSIRRRITERMVTARANNVDGYTASIGTGPFYESTDIPVRPLWGCSAEPLGSSRWGDPALTKLKFPTPLQLGEKHYFASETVKDDAAGQLCWVNVEIDHHGVAPGRLLDGLLPINGLTIRIQFERGYLPEECWWYAEYDRHVRPGVGDPHVLPIRGNGVVHTFTQGCQPRGHYGISILWPRRVGTARPSPT
jgi:hypothetical protein